MHDRGRPFTDAVDEVFGASGIKVLRAPARTPAANAFAERWVGTIRRQLSDRTIIWSRQQLERLVADDIDHYNHHRPHRSRAQIPTRTFQEPTSTLR